MDPIETLLDSWYKRGRDSIKPVVSEAPCRDCGQITTLWHHHWPKDNRIYWLCELCMNKEREEQEKWSGQIHSVLSNK